MDGLVTSSHAIETRRFSPPEMPLAPLSPTRLSRIPRIPSSCIVSSVRMRLSSNAMSRGRRSRAEYRTVSNTGRVPMSVSSWSTKPTTRRYSDAETCRPLTRISPDTAPRFDLRARRSSRVDLPAPDAPRTAMTSPGWTAPEIESRRRRPEGSVYDRFEN